MAWWMPAPLQASKRIARGGWVPRLPLLPARSQVAAISFCAEHRAQGTRSKPGCRCWDIILTKLVHASLSSWHDGPGSLHTE